MYREDTSSIIWSALFWQSVVLVVLFMSILGVVFTLAYLVSAEMLHHRGRLSHVALQLKHEVDRIFFIGSRPLGSDGCASVQSKELEERVQFLKHNANSVAEMIDALATIDSVSPSKVSGFTIERQHIVWIGTTLIVFIYTIISFVSKEDLLGL